MAEAGFDPAHPARQAALVELPATPVRALPIRLKPTPTAKPIVIGLYGIPGCGKTFLANQLKYRLDTSRYVFFEGSAIITNLAGSLDAFKTLNVEEKKECREKAITFVQDETAKSGKIGIITGHLLFTKGPSAIADTCENVFTPKDGDVYTHIIYLNTDPNFVASFREANKTRSRPEYDVKFLRNWQQTEMEALRQLCQKHKILFAPVTATTSGVVPHVASLVENFRLYTPTHNELVIKERVKSFMARSNPDGALKHVIALDADGTLAPEDSGRLFWGCLGTEYGTLGGDYETDTLGTVGQAAADKVFGRGGEQDYSFRAFQQLALAYEELAVNSPGRYDVACKMAAGQIRMYPEMVALLRRLVRAEHDAPVIVTCGVAQIWRRVLRDHGLPESIEVIGVERFRDGLVVTPITKVQIVWEVRLGWGVKVCAFGDSYVDLDMLTEADEAIVVVGDTKPHSETMKRGLAERVRLGLNARQLLLPVNAQPRLSTYDLPLVQWKDHWLNRAAFKNGKSPKIYHTTDRVSAKLLATPMRDASCSGPALRAAHRDAGRYLAAELLGEVLGLENVPVPHVQGSLTTGYRLLGEDQTLIVPLMRGGEPMAFGVNDVLPGASFRHAHKPSDIQSVHVRPFDTVILVDSVVNTGKSVVEFVEHLRSIQGGLRIVVVAGVVQRDATVEGALADMLVTDHQLDLVALRLSENKYKGKGKTDSGNRLFNTTFLD